MSFMSNRLRRLTMLAIPAVCCLVAACDSGSGGGNPAPTPTPTSTPTPAPTNRAPVFTSAAAITIVENAEVYYHATATDADGDQINFEIVSSSPDAKAFTITGDVVRYNDSFRNPNYDAPTDVDRDNVYHVTLAANDGKAITKLDLTMTVTNDTEGLSLTKIAQLTDPVLARRDPTNDHALLVGERSGAIYRLFKDGTKTLLMSVGNLDLSNGGGLISFGRSNSQTDPNMYVYAKSADGSLQLRVIDYSGGPGTEHMVSSLQIAPPGTTGNYGGWLLVNGTDVYLGTGDGGGIDDPNNNAQNVTSRLGKILKFFGSNLGPPIGAPFFPGADRYVYAIGVRNPRNGFENGFNGFVFADSGSVAYEEINRVGSGLNYGWPYLEGDRPIRGTASTSLFAPLTMYAHGAGAREGGSIAGGIIYRGPGVLPLGTHLFGDAVTGHLWTMKPVPTPSRDFEVRDLDFRPASGSFGKPIIVANNGYWDVFVINQAGEVYLMPGTPH